MIAQYCLWAAFGVAALAAGWDVATRRIPNWSVLLLGGLSLAHVALGGDWGLVGSAALHALIALLIGMVLFRFGLIGAGDAKLYAAAALAVPLGKALAMLGFTALIGFVVWIALFIVNRGMRRVTADGKRTSWTLPYGLPIAAGFILASLGTGAF